MTSYGYTVRWKAPTGETAVSVSGCATPEEAVSEAEKLARRDGWPGPYGSWWNYVWAWLKTRAQLQP